jgi:hypothetical protein
MIIETDNEIIIKIYEFYKFLKYYNKYLNEWSDKNDLDNLEKSYKILFNNTETCYKLNCAKGWSQRNIYHVNEYIFNSINVDLYVEYKKQHKLVNNINLNIEHYNVVFGDNILCRNNLNRLCLKRDIFGSYVKFLKRGVIRMDNFFRALNNYNKLL